MIDAKFPIIRYAKNQSWRERGRAHGEQYREAITELADIREQLILGRNPSLKSRLASLSQIQWEKTEQYDSDVFEELEGIRQGADCSIQDLVVLNNYTDFRDIPPDEGCSVVYVKREDHCLAGQTWDMHSSARNYVCVIHLPEDELGKETYLFSLVGCVGMMGFQSGNTMVAINNLNTIDAQAGVLWPAFVRKALKLDDSQKMTELLKQTPVTSAHSYLLADHWSASLFERTPTQCELIGHIDKNIGSLVHTNHCLSEVTRKIEESEFLSKTTHQRLNLLNAKIDSIHTLSGLNQLLMDHEEYPKSICSHFESGAQDPSYTCGGAVADMDTMEMVFWRGCERSKDWWVEHRFEMSTS